MIEFSLPLLSHFYWLFFRGIIHSSALASGAEGTTKDQLWQFAAKSLCEQGQFPADFNESSYLYHIKQLNSSLAQGIPEYYLYNGLYTNKNTDLYSDYKKRIRQNLDMNIVSADFAHPEKVESKINQTVEKFTNGLVKDCLTPGTIRPDLPYLMFNVLGYVGKWQNEFDESSTTEAEFHAVGQEPVKTSFMRDTIGSFREMDKYTLFWLDYAQSTARFVVVLPEENTKLQQLIRETGKNIFQEYVSLMNTPQKKFDKSIDNTRELYLPKFEFFTPPQDCSDALQKEGATECFLPGKANFSRMMTYSHNIESILQKCYLKIDEQGTKAYAVTTVEPECLELPEKIKELRTDRPFLCFIMDTKTNLILFAAVINDPTKTGNPATLMDFGENLP